MRPDFTFLRRFGSLIQQLGGGAWDTAQPAYVSLIDDRTYNSSRERAPMAYDWFTRVAAGAGTHNAILIDAQDGATGSQKPVACMLHQLFLESPGSAAGWTVGIVAESSLTFATGPTARTPISRDVDPEVTPRIRVATVATASIPALGTTGIMIMQARDTVTQNWNQLDGFSPKWLPQLQFDCPDRVFVAIQNTEALQFTWRAQWQAVRK